MSVNPFIAAALVFVMVGAAAVVVPATASPPPVAEQARNLETCRLTISGMTCAGCAAAVGMAAKKVDGVNDAVVSYEKGRAEVTYDPVKTTPEEIAKAITEGSGFKAELRVQMQK